MTEEEKEKRRKEKEFKEKLKYWREKKSVPINYKVDK